MKRNNSNWGAEPDMNPGIPKCPKCGAELEERYQAGYPYPYCPECEKGFNPRDIRR